MKPVLCARNIAFAYGTRAVLDDLSFSLFPGEMVALMGANGSGKTTLLKISTGLLRPQSGEVLYEGKQLNRYKRRELARHIALVPQEVHVTFDFTVQQFIEQGRTPHLSSFFGTLQEHDRSAVWQAMDCANVAHLAGRNFNELSGGERQRVKIALAVAQQPKVLLLDEPTQHLDVGRQAEVFAVLQRLNASGIAIIAAVHDLQGALAHFTTGMLINPGAALVCGPTAEILTPTAIRQVFSVSLPPGTSLGTNAETLSLYPN